MALMLRHDSSAGLCGRLDQVEVDAVRPEVRRRPAAPARASAAPCAAASAARSALALRGAHRAVVEVEVQEADGAVLLVADRRARSASPAAHPARAAPRARRRAARPAPCAAGSLNAARRRRARLQVPDPDRAVDGGAQHRAVARARSPRPARAARAQRAFGVRVEQVARQRRSSSSRTPGKPSAARILRSTVARVVALPVDARGRPAASAAAAGRARRAARGRAASARTPPVANRSQRLPAPPRPPPRSPRCGTGWPWSPRASGRSTLAQTSPASISAFGLQHRHAPLASRRPGSPSRAPTARGRRRCPGWTTRQTCVRQIDSGNRALAGTARRSGRAGTARPPRSVTASLMSNSTDTSWPRAVSSTHSRCVRLLKRVGEEQDAHRRRSADPRQLLAGQPVDDAPAAEARCPSARSGARRRCTSPMIAASRPSGCARIAASSALGVVGGADRDQLALVGDVERIEAEELAGGRHLAAAPEWRPRRASCRRPTGAAISFSVVARPPRVGSRRHVDVRHRRQHRRDQAVQRGGVGLDGGRRRSRFSRCDMIATPWSPMRAARRRIASPGRARSPEMSTPSRHHADAGGGDEHAVALALLDHLGVAGDDRHAGLARGRAPSTRRCASGRRAESLPRG